ncbi:hypothetical protein PoB_001037200 [Plakobranchus ocellatus]|uniref:Peptidase S1 domain-containing protein n=1 Tax=Plakobranchus ocellatus TaxID=259542 RepID=A0AAV3YLR3_9GAST|nr:hypothetical protein PoB_001037200 [Plakobranchus ocellatus]
MPLCQDVLMLHTQRANFQTKIWRASSSNFPDLPKSDNTEWRLSSSGGLEIKWFSKDFIPKELQDILPDTFGTDNALEKKNCKMMTSPLMKKTFLTQMMNYIYDCQLFGSGPEAAESDDAWGKCFKHPGHANFIPVSEFGEEHLPDQYRSKSVVDIVKAVANVTVKLVVRLNSATRLPFNEYCYSLRGDTNSIHVGSGWIIDVEKGFGPCQGCSECSRSSPFQGEELSKDKEQWYFVYVVTASHVVFDVDEAEATEVQIFYDDKKSRKDKRMKSIYGVALSRECSQDDSSVVRCVTHDESLAHELFRNAEKMKMIFVKRDLGIKAEESVWGASPDNRLCIVVSHPHGQPKMVTLGERKEIERIHLLMSKKMSNEMRRQFRIRNPLFYTTETCPGSSGAPVFMPTCIETRKKDPDKFSFVETLVIRSHSIGGVFDGAGLSGGLPPLSVLPRLPLQLQDSEKDNFEEVDTETAQ